MRAFILVPFFLVSACIPRPGDVAVSNPRIAEYAERFCAADFESSNRQALGEWVGIYNLLAPVVGQDPIDFEAQTQRQTVQQLLLVRSGICLAFTPAPAPEVLEATAPPA